MRNVFAGAGAGVRTVQAAGAEALRARRATRTARAGDHRGDVLCVMDREMCVLDVAYVHPASLTHRRAAARSEKAAATTTEARRCTEYRSHSGLDGHKLVPFAIETHGRVGSAAMKLLTKLGHMAEAHSSGLLRHLQFVERTLPCLAVIGVEYNERIEAAAAGNLALAPGQAYMRGESSPAWDPGTG